MVGEMKKVDKSSRSSSSKTRKERIIQKLKEHGCRITRQRLIILNIILEEQCSCCKEIYFKALKLNHKIGVATVYRMINILEDIGEIDRGNILKISSCHDCKDKKVCTIEFDDDSVIELSEKKWNKIIEAGLSAYGYTNKQTIRCIRMKPLK